MKKNYYSLLTMPFFTLLFSLFLLSADAIAQMPCKVLVGYWQNSWGTYVRLKDINSNYNVICLSFLEADKNLVETDNSINDLEFTPSSNSDINIVANLKADIITLQGQGKLVLMSIGGATGSFKLNSVNDKNTFVSKTKAAIQAYGVNGIDIDLEQATYVNQAGTISNPSAHIAYVIQGIEELLAWYQTTYGKKMILTMAPEIPYTTGGLSQYQTNGYPYLAMIEALRDDIDLMMVQLYNAGEMYGLSGSTLYYDGTADFIVSQTEAIIKGFTAKNSKGTYSGLPANKVVVALPATSGSAGSGYVTTAVAKSAVKYLMGTGSKPGSYTLVQSGGYPDLAGMMTWSINEDMDNAYAFATNYASIFGTGSANCTVSSGEIGVKDAFSIYPNPANNQLIVMSDEKSSATLTIYNSLGSMVLQKTLTQGSNVLDISSLSAGLYLISNEREMKKIIVE
ncbi:MAG: glycosyl hydrolase family 18 protein [Bacteroidetes bacterium]|nr:glycosyl hydrolase family 18 protein [Bacteroidota bacterium]